MKFTLLGLLTMSVLVGCTVGQDRQSRSMEVVIDSTGIHLEPTTAIAARRADPRNSGKSLRYELRGEDGSVLSSGKVADPRHIFFEFDDPQTTRGRAFANAFGTFVVRLPAKAGTLVVLAPGANGEVELGRVAYDPTSSQHESALLDSSTDVGQLVTLQSSGPADQKIDLLFVSEGYTADQLDEFHADVQRAVSELAASPDWGAHFMDLNIHYVDVTSYESGVDDPDNKIARDTAFDATFGTGDLHRATVLSEAGYKAASQLQTQFSADTTIVLLNSTEWGGTGGSITVMTKAQNIGQLLAHELGHTLVGLADEYDYGFTDDRCPYATQAPNLAQSAARESLPWAQLIDAATPLPTTSPDSTTVGAYEGGGYCTTKMFRPSHSCLMREADKPMCAVCRHELERLFGNLPNDGGDPPGGNECPEEWRGDNVCDPCLGDDPDCDVDDGDNPFDECPETWRGDGICDDCLGDDPDCAMDDPSQDTCPESWRGDGICDECLYDDPDCAIPTDSCPESWRGDGICDECLFDDPDCF
jgi:hypothetical protein